MKAKEQGVLLVGPDGLPNQLTKRVLETELEGSEHPGYDKYPRPAEITGTPATGSGPKQC